MPHVKHMFKTASDMDMATQCAYKLSKYSLPHYKFLFRCCSRFLSIDLPSPELNQHNSNVSNTIRIHVYHLISRYNA